MDRPRDPMTLPRCRGAGLRGPPRRIRLKLAVKTARIAHNRHPPEAKNDNAAAGRFAGCCHCVLSRRCPLRPNGMWSSRHARYFSHVRGLGTFRVRTCPVRGGPDTEVRIRTLGVFRVTVDPRPMRGKPMPGQENALRYRPLSATHALRLSVRTPTLLGWPPS